MADMVAELGPKYLGFALDVLESALPEKGYMGHIRGYTLHYLLEGLCKVCHAFMATSQAARMERTLSVRHTLADNSTLLKVYRKECVPAVWDTLNQPVELTSLDAFI